MTARRESAANGMGRLLAGIALALLSGGCATSLNTLTKSELAMLHIESVDIRYAPNAHIWWGNAEREYAAKVGVPDPKQKDTKDKDTKNKDATANAISPRPTTDDEYDKLISTPAAKEYLRTKLTGMIRERIEQSVLPSFRGTRAVRLEIEVRTFVIPSPLQRIAFGGTPMLGTVTVLRDSKTGEQLAKLDRANAAYAGGGLLGVAADQAFSDLEDRVLDNYMDNISDWLTPV
jgi:hypothetical protein